MRKSPISPALGLLILLLLVAFVGSAVHFGEPKEVVPWRHDFAAAKQEAVSGDKPLLVDFWATWCGPCQEMRRTTWSDRSVADALTKYVPVSIDIDAHPDLAGQFHVESIPCVFIVDVKTGKIVKENRQGLLPPEDFLQWLNGS